MIKDKKTFARTGTLVIVPTLKFDQISAQDLSFALDEAIGLTQAIELEVVYSEIVKLSAFRPGTFLTSGKVEEIANIIKKSKIEAQLNSEHYIISEDEYSSNIRDSREDLEKSLTELQDIPSVNKEIKLVVIDHSISPVQQRNLEKAWACKVIDRTALILEIFGARAATREGILQVELAALEYQKGRLVRSWTHLERQRGGFGFLGGPGESQIESDRRAISDKIIKIKGQLEKVTRTRELHRKSRRAVPYPIVALVGYTNAGKSTLFNSLTNAEVYAEDKLFATLDPTMRQLSLPSGHKIILSDTVGFVSRLPTELIAAFRATLEEVIEADLLLHVRDISHPQTIHQKEDVEQVLNDLGIKDKYFLNHIEVLNKVDLLEHPPLLQPGMVAISASKKINLDQLLNIIDERIRESDLVEDIQVPITNGKVIAWIYEHSAVLKREDSEEFITFTLSISSKHWSQLRNLLLD